MKYIQEAVFDKLRQARTNADKKWDRGEENPGPWITDPHFANTILGEEVGEVSRALLEETNLELYRELLDVGQVVIAWLEALHETYPDASL